MENYKKGKNVEATMLITDIPIANIPEDALWMQVRGGSKMRNVISHATDFYKENKDNVSCIWTGYGPSVEKAISCAEIMKRNFNFKLHQITKICYRTVEEYWDPISPELDQLVVRRKLPMVHIYLSSKPLDNTELGYQAPGKFVPYQDDGKYSKGQSSTNKKEHNGKNTNKRN